MRQSKSDDQRQPKQPAQESGTYPSGMEGERQEPEGGPGKPKPSPEYRPDDDAVGRGDQS